MLFHPFILLVLAGYAVFVVVLFAVALWSKAAPAKTAANPAAQLDAPRDGAAEPTLKAAA